MTVNMFSPVSGFTVLRCSKDCTAGNYKALLIPNRALAPIKQTSAAVLKFHIHSCFSVQRHHRKNANMAAATYVGPLQVDINGSLYKNKNKQYTNINSISVCTNINVDFNDILHFSVTDV